jgi:hypothetical protein
VVGFVIVVLNNFPLTHLTRISPVLAIHGGAVISNFWHNPLVRRTPLDPLVQGRRPLHCGHSGPVFSTPAETRMDPAVELVVHLAYDLINHRESV